ncbi:hypothetical protein CXG81DRAFT_24141 [Caulochytrium protostelioides]|uniref:Histone deacetylase complex subunit SAP30 Sin3 binding domain-containing protein n=1 Tax=Caulochytrium protostelioides TaxID=1555241 RepID=A0A4P9XCS7_9FUNG|nr:hypothetical protein CXG81DRAFT_24141 [Caulochytrium protostelioides]|eukprot:RKP03256.1 hypothetical protein CXG81DRAFT_24141 [Caulochytrium protostelioides]
MDFTQLNDAQLLRYTRQFRVSSSIPLVPPEAFQELTRKPAAAATGRSALAPASHAAQAPLSSSIQTAPSPFPVPSPPSSSQSRPRSHADDVSRSASPQPSASTPSAASSGGVPPLTAASASGSRASSSAASSTASSPPPSLRGEFAGGGLGGGGGLALCPASWGKDLPFPLPLPLSGTDLLATAAAGEGSPYNHAHDPNAHGSQIASMRHGGAGGAHGVSCSGAGAAPNDSPTPPLAAAPIPLPAAPGAREPSTRSALAALACDGGGRLRAGLLDAVDTHFRAQEVHEKEAITHFIYALRHRDAVLKLPLPSKWGGPPAAEDDGGAALHGAGAGTTAAAGPGPDAHAEADALTGPTQAGRGLDDMDGRDGLVHGLAAGSLLSPC